MSQCHRPMNWLQQGLCTCCVRGLPLQPRPALSLLSLSPCHSPLPDPCCGVLTGRITRPPVLPPPHGTTGPRDLGFCKDEGTV